LLAAGVLLFLRTADGISMARLYCRPFAAALHFNS
jgi:hypothetical protein